MFYPTLQAKFNMIRRREHKSRNSISDFSFLPPEETADQQDMYAPLNS
jgi:hypothetical protein